MTEQVCPSCEEKGFVWVLDESEDVTKWHCSLCQYQAVEREDLESVCGNCRTLNNMYLQSGDEFFRYCTNCLA